jgi:hypothetical protein
MMTTKKRTTSKKTEAKAPQPMDPGAPEVRTPTASTNRRRDCWAIKTLVAEFLALFPETPYETDGYDGRNTALHAQFDLSVLDQPERDTATALLELVETDERVAEVLAEDDYVMVLMHSNPRTQDSRNSFGLGDAYLVLTEGSL